MVYFYENWRARRSVLYMPSSNRRALMKAASLDCDGVIFDLEDSVAAKDQDAARENLLELVRGQDFGQREIIIRVSGRESDEFEKDFEIAVSCNPDAILVPKVETPEVLADLDRRLADFAAKDMKLWAMIESPRALVNLKEIAALGYQADSRLNCLVVGPNDLARDSGIAMEKSREVMVPWLMDIVAHGRANGLAILDGVFNAFGDGEGLEVECLQGAAMGFDGKTLIHPAQIEAANRFFSPGEKEIIHAREVVALFARPENMGKNALQLNGEMIERLHLGNAENLLELVNALKL